MQKKSERYRLARKKKNWNPRGWILKGDFETLKKEQRLLVNGLLAKAGWWVGRSDGFRNLLLPDCEQETSLRRLPPRLQLLRLDPPRLSCQGINIRCVWLSHEMKVGGNIKVNQSHVSSFLFRVSALVRSLLRRHESPQDGLRLLAGGKINQINGQCELWRSIRVWVGQNITNMRPSAEDRWWVCPQTTVTYCRHDSTGFDETNINEIWFWRVLVNISLIFYSQVGLFIQLSISSWQNLQLCKFPINNIESHWWVGVGKKAIRYFPKHFKF